MYGLWGAAPRAYPRQSRPARAGAEVTLVERYGSLGGLATGGLSVWLLTLDDGRGRQVPDCARN